MPLRKWMTEHGHPGWYSWLVVILGCVVSMIVSVGISVRMNNAAIQREHQAQALAAQREAERRAQQRVVSCAFVNKINRAYQDQIKELSGPGLTIAAAWADLARECP